MDHPVHKPMHKPMHDPMRPYVLYGWQLSYFTGKVRCYLRFKGIPFEDRPVDMFTLMHRVRRRTGAVVMPVVVTPEGEWLQDSSVIIDHLERRFPTPTIHSDNPVQRFASYLMEAWGDEWWVPIAMHTRWSYPENYALFEREAGAHLLPGFPRFLKRRAASYVAATLRGKLHAVGVRPEQFALLDSWTRHMLDLLDAHFARVPYLFGAQPSLGDFGLVGSMAAHLGRDPWPARELIAPRPHLRAWIDRMESPDHGTSETSQVGAATVLGAPPTTLDAIFRVIFAEFTPMLEGIAEQVQEASAHLAHGQALPRGLKDVAIPTPFGTFRRRALPYTLWMAQRTLEVFQAMPKAAQESVQQWAQPLGGTRFLALQIPPLERRGLCVARAADSHQAAT